MSKRKILILLAGGVVATMLFAAGCRGTSTATPEATSEPNGEVNTTGTLPTNPTDLVGGLSGQAGVGGAEEEPINSIAPGEVDPISLPSVGISGREIAIAPDFAFAPAAQLGSNQQAGISVSGQGEIDVVPDLAILNLGVEARAATVALARTQAARSLDQMVQVLKDRNIEDRDIQTRFFNISPEYIFNRSTERQELTGYRVNNQLSVRVRDIANIGPIIDEVADAGGDLVRIQGINFSVEDTEALENLAREAAVNDMLNKAQQFADLTGVNLGRPVFLAESGGSVSTIGQSVSRLAFADAEGAVSTPISAGELTVSVFVQGVFAIE